ncbi:hypothetical protein RhiirA5_357133 [Rhizophagus irregularis]|uniref:Uncharacterized protein n=2 Tax=Rhizophagus irregularis TaxID=588596 RepID=A0A2I1EPY3_9GLOM|nr:hypothetical protein RhiirA5_357133 [Rhizophagus irregularis]PKC67453.1 hypothetical protein RhiirA1_418130 [Rhizophagus irregularis]PKY24174.1 hypothetical protein RhiirB3_412751 [Rhizophagus irregularis]
MAISFSLKKEKEQYKCSYGKIWRKSSIVKYEPTPPEFKSGKKLVKRELIDLKYSCVA